MTSTVTAGDGLEGADDALAKHERSGVVCVDSGGGVGGVVVVNRSSSGSHGQDELCGSSGLLSPYLTPETEDTDGCLR